MDVGGLRWVRPAPTPRTVLSLLLVAAFGAAVLRVDLQAGALHAGGVAAAGQIARSLLAPDLSPAFLLIVGEATLLTLAYAVTGMGVAIAIGLPGAILVSGSLVTRPGPRVLTTTGARGVFGALRAVHELIWALLLLSVLGLHPLTGVLAIGIPYGATLARVLGEHLQNTDARPLEALRSSGASNWEVLLYGRIPLAGADLLAYLAYRFECAVRAAAVLSFVGLGGIGYRLTLSLADLRFERVWPLLGALVVLIALIDLVSGRLRRGVVA